MFYLILGSLFLVMHMIISQIPIIELTTFQVEAITQLFVILHKSSFFVPWSTIIICMSLIGAYYTGLFTTKLMNWIIHRFPIVG